jgi:predicted anti-sigma-YlaC factor YlaD
MTEHVTAALEAYHDGELHGRRLEQVETHLAQCASCRAELDALQSLAALLQESPAPEGLTPPDRFVAQVNLRLPRSPERTVWQRALHRGWQLVPVGLLGAWTFVQAAFLVAGAVLIAAQLGLGGSLAASLLPASQGGLPGLAVSSLNEFGHVVLNTLGAGGPLGWAFTLNLALSALIAILYWSWLASWWVRTRNHRA